MLDNRRQRNKENRAREGDAGRVSSDETTATSRRLNPDWFQREGLPLLSTRLSLPEESRSRPLSRRDGRQLTAAAAVAADVWPSSSWAEGSSGDCSGRPSSCGRGPRKEDWESSATPRFRRWSLPQWTTSFQTGAAPVDCGGNWNLGGGGGGAAEGVRGSSPWGARGGA